MKDNRIKSSAEKIKMPDELKNRIIDRCREVETTMNENKDNREYTEHVFDVERVKERNILRTVSAVAACAVLVGGIGATGYYMNKQGRPHQTTEIIDGTDVTTEAVTESAETVTKNDVTTESVTDLAEATETTTAAYAGFDKAEILKYIVVPPEDTVLAGCLYYITTVTDAEGHEVSFESNQDLPHYKIDYFKQFMESCDFTEADRTSVNLSDEELLEFRLTIPYNEDVYSVFSFYKNGICNMKVYENEWGYNEEKGFTEGTPVLLEEHFFNIDSEAAYSTLQDEHYDDEDYDIHDLSRQPEGYVCPTPSFEYGDFSYINAFSAEDEILEYTYFLDEDEFSELSSEVFTGIDWTSYEISENDAEITIFNYRSPKLYYMVNVKDAQGCYLCNIFVYDDGYVEWCTNFDDIYMNHTYKFDNSELVDRLNAVINGENTYERIEH